VPMCLAKFSIREKKIGVHDFEIIPTRRHVFENKLKTTFNKVYGP